MILTAVSTNPSVLGSADMEMMIWNIVLTAVVAIMGFLFKGKIDELDRLGILLNKTREEVAREHAQHISVGTLNVDDYPDIAQRYSVMSIPTVLIFVDGRVDKQIVGAYPKDKFVEKISQYLG